MAELNELVLANSLTPKVLNGEKSTNGHNGCVPNCRKINTCNGNIRSITASKRSQKCLNPIRMIMESLSIKPNPSKHLIQISQGDPAINNLFPLPEEMKTAVKDAVECSQYNCYFPSAGLEITRNAISEYYAEQGVDIDWKDIVITTGCTQAILWSIDALTDPGDNILVPKPCFSIYKTFAAMTDLYLTYYNLIPEKNWCVDLAHLESMIKPSTKAIIINNPSNPCGSVFSKQHLEDIIAIAQHHNLVIISDEVYSSFIFPGHKFYSMASLTQKVPILVCNSLSKMFIIPGWRIGWVAMYDPANQMSEVKMGINRFSQANFGASSIMQSALVGILKNTPKSYIQSALSLIYKNALSIHSGLSGCPGVVPYMPQGSMFMMIKIEMQNYPQFLDESEIVEKLISEESVFPFPSTIFGLGGYLRISLVLTNENACTAAQRMNQFFTRYYKSSH